MSKQEPEYEEGLEPLTSAGIRSMCVGLSDEQQSNFMVEIGAAIERMLESDRVDVLVDVTKSLDILIVSGEVLCKPARIGAGETVATSNPKVVGEKSFGLPTEPFFKYIWSGSPFQATPITTS